MDPREKQETNTPPVPPAGQNMEKAANARAYLRALMENDFQTAWRCTDETVELIRSHGGEKSTEVLNGAIFTRLDVLLDLFGYSPDYVWEDGFCPRQDYEILAREPDPEKKRLLLQALYETLALRIVGSLEPEGRSDEVLRYIEENYGDNNLSIASVADHFGISVGYLSRSFKENTGVTLMEFLHGTRIENAKRLLQETDLTLDEVARQVGYLSGWTFSRAFRRSEQVTPGEYRKLTR